MSIHFSRKIFTVVKFHTTETLSRFSFSRNIFLTRARTLPWTSHTADLFLHSPHQYLPLLLFLLLLLLIRMRMAHLWQDDDGDDDAQTDIARERESAHDVVNSGRSTRHVPNVHSLSWRVLLRRNIFTFISNDASLTSICCKVMMSRCIKSVHLVTIVCMIVQQLEPTYLHAHTEFQISIGGRGVSSSSSA